MWIWLRVSRGVTGQVSLGRHHPDTGLGCREDGGPASRWHLARPLAGASVQVLSRTSPRGAPNAGRRTCGEWTQESKEEATVCVIASLRDHNLVFLEYPVGCSVSPAPPRGRHHAGEHSGQAGGPAALGTNWPLGLGVCLSVQSCQEPPPRVRLGREIAGQDVKHAHR